MRRAAASLAAAALSAAVVVGAPAAACAQSNAPSTPSPVTGGGALRLDPPVNRDLVLTISDRRLLADGGEAIFTIHNRLRFTRGDGGLIATLRRDQIDCIGPDAICETYRRAMASWVGTVQRYAIFEDGSINTLIAADLDGVGAGSQLAMSTLAQVEQERPGALGMAEMRELLRYIGRPLDTASLLAATDQQPDQLSVTLSNNGREAHVNSQTSLRLAADPSVQLVRSRADEIDLATGLLTGSRTTMVDPTHAATPVSIRDWQLTP